MDNYIIYKGFYLKENAKPPMQFAQEKPIPFYSQILVAYMIEYNKVIYDVS